MEAENNNSTIPTARPSTPLPTPSEHSTQSDHHSSASEIVLQWLTYSLWGWTVIGLDIVLSTVITYYFINSARSSNYEWVIYVVASLLVLLPIAMIVDRLYAKREPQHKKGFAAVVLVLNAVIVFLSTIGGLIALVVSLMRLFTSATNSSGTYITIASSIVVSVLGSLLFLRIMKFSKTERISKRFSLIVAIITAGTVIMAIAGPIRSEASAKNDRLIESNISTVSEAVRSYASKNSKLPNNLTDLDLSGPYQADAKILITKKLVTYEKGQVNKTNPSSPAVTKNGDSAPSFTTQTASYTLCVTYSKANNGGFSYGEAETDYYINTFNHPAGKKCYKQTASLGTSTEPYIQPAVDNSSSSSGSN